MEEIIKKGIEKKFFYPPEKCTCGNTKISLNKLNRNKNTSFCFRCTRKNCKKIYPLRNNLFFENFNYIPLNECFMLLDCFINLKFNAKRAYKYLKETKHLILSEKIIRKFYRATRKIIYLYYLIEYETEEFSTENENAYYSVDESQFTSNNQGEQIWVLGITKNTNKNFRIVASKKKGWKYIKKIYNPLYQ